MMIRYPDNLPSPLLDDRGMKKIDGVERTEMGDGSTFQRLVFEDTPNNLHLSWIMSQIEAFQFQQWHAGAIKGGALEFIMPVLMTDGRRDRVCKFMSMYDGPNKISPRLWRISAQIQVLDQVSEGINPDWWQFPEWIRYASLFDVTMNKHWPEA